MNSKSSKPSWFPTLKSVVMTDLEHNSVCLESLIDFVPVQPLCEIIIDYLKFVNKKGPSYCDVFKYLDKRITPIKNFWGDANDLRQMLELDWVSEIELTQDGNQGGNYYRCFFKVKRFVCFRKNGKKKLLMPTTAYQIVPMGSPDEPWPLPEMGGPNILEMSRNKTIYRLSNGVLFDCVPDYYQVTFIRR
jgi:hypothetical protein